MLKNRAPASFGHAPTSWHALPKSFVHRAALALVWLAIATSGLVFSEPAPTDALTIGLIILLPLVGLFRGTPVLTFYLCLWLVAAACAFFAAGAAGDIGRASTHTGVSLYLYLASFVIAGFVALKPDAHARLIFQAYFLAAIVAAIAGIIGYVGGVPGAEVFTKFGRASGTFKDPNVFGPFLVPAFLYALHLALERPLSRMVLPLSAAALLAVGVLMSFSRGAWINLVVALILFAVLSLFTAKSAAQRAKILAFGAFGAGMLVAVVVLALQFDRIASLMTERASVTQSYDVGPDGRFGGQQKAFGLILDHPAGLGAQEFAGRYHHEEPHNVYLNMHLNAGWIGGAIFIAVFALTIAVGLFYAFAGVPALPFYLIAWSSFVANAFEGAIIDLDHWRHVYLMLAIVWGILAAHREQIASRGPHAARRSMPSWPAIRTEVSSSTARIA